MSFVKYRLKEVATDFGTTPKEIADIIAKYGERPKSNTQVLTDEELNVVFDHMTKNRQVADLQQALGSAAPTRKPEAPKSEGNYYLLKDVTTTGQTVVNKGETVRLDLNGHDVVYDVSPTSSDGYRVYRSAFESTLVITDTTDAPGSIRSDMPTEAEVLKAVNAKLESGDYDQAKADKIIAAQKAGNFGSVLWARGGDIVLHNGIIDGSNLNGSKSGMTVYAGANDASEDDGVTRVGTFTMYGGVVKGATSSAYGGSLYGTGSSRITIHGGIVEDGKATNASGGNV